MKRGEAKEKLNEMMGTEEEDSEEFVYYNEKFKQYIVKIDPLANFFCKKYHFLTIIGKTKETLILWNGKIWEYGAESFIKKKCEEILGKHAKINPITEIIAKIKRRNHISPEEFDKIDINLIPLENGVFNLKTKELEEHSPKNHFKTIIPINYDKNSECPVFLKFINEALYPEDIPVLQEWFGFNLYREYLIKKAFIVFGETNTGKTKVINALISFVGEQNKTGLSLQKISNGTDFNRLSLKDKLANIYDDLSSKDLNDGGNLKIATGGGYISGEEKFGDYTQFKSYAKLTFATNKIPPVKDSDDMAYFSRWIVLRFDNVPDKMDLFLDEKIRKELPGVLNWALEGLFRLLENGDFSYKRTPEEVKLIMEMSGDPLIQFGEACLEVREGERISKDDMYMIYSVWANENKKPLLSKEQLGRRLNTKVKYLVPKNDIKGRYWDNVVFKTEWKTKLDTLDTSKNIISNAQLYNNSPLDIIKNKASNPSKDSISEEEIKFEELEDE